MWFQGHRYTSNESTRGERGIGRMGVAPDRVYSFRRDEEWTKRIHPARKKNPPTKFWFWKTVIARSGSIACPSVHYNEDAHLRDIFTFYITNISTLRISTLKYLTAPAASVVVISFAYYLYFYMNGWSASHLFWLFHAVYPGAMYYWRSIGKRVNFHIGINSK